MHRRIFYRCVDWNCQSFCWWKSRKVASFTDAWIETPLWVGNLWLSVVASFTDAWIETFPLYLVLLILPSHLLQMRGLKPVGYGLCCISYRSHLLQMRGLKLLGSLLSILSGRRIFYRCVDWNFFCYQRDKKHCGRIFYRCVDWNWSPPAIVNSPVSRIFYRCVDWNFLKLLTGEEMVSRIFYRCVDWNRKCPCATLPYN